MKIVVIGGSSLIGSKLVVSVWGNRGNRSKSRRLPTRRQLDYRRGTRGGHERRIRGRRCNELAFLGGRGSARVFRDFNLATCSRPKRRRAWDIHVALSVAGTERLVESGFFRAKLAQENLIKQGSIPYSIVRATQFFEFVKSIADLSTDGNKIRLPAVLIQPMAADDVAGAVARVAVGSPIRGTIEVGGPEQFRLDELIRRDLAARKDPREVITDPHARYYGIAVSETALQARR